MKISFSLVSDPLKSLTAETCKVQQPGPSQLRVAWFSSCAYSQHYPWPPQLQEAAFKNKITYFLRYMRSQYRCFLQAEPTAERLYPLPSSMLCYRDLHTWDSGLWLWEPGWWVGPIHFRESVFMHMPRVCIFSTYFRQLLMLVWLGQHFKMQFLPLLTTDAFKALW